ncbi:GAF domain-containing protein [Lyngbya aestuarii]|uniref:GAF domain-containing protein n=1 Tax=Lyngbya aestuarii TaxID=118322 RepID=UPI0004104505|nr:GAF domain-containing protein [Lyngbya aestuarii]
MSNQKLNSDNNPNRVLYPSSDPELEKFNKRLKANGKRDFVVQETLNRLLKKLQVNRVVLYYFYRQWEGQVTFEALSHPQWSIYGSTGADECFNDEYAALYIAGRTRAISDVEVEPIHDCHKDFLRSIEVRANLVVPVLLDHQQLWGLLIAHHCESSRSWLPSDIELLQDAAQALAVDLAYLS